MTVLNQVPDDKPFHSQGILHEDMCKIPKNSESADKVEQHDGPEGDEAVEVEESTSYEDWLCDRGLSMNSTETTKFNVKVQVEDITDNENENSRDEGSSKNTEENSEVQKCDRKITDSTKKEDTKVKQDTVTEVKTLDSIKFKVKDLINKGETVENCENRIKRLEMILNLLNEDEKESGEASDKIGDDSTCKMEEENDKDEVTMQKQVPIRKIEKEGETKISPEISNDETVAKNLQGVEKADDSVVKNGNTAVDGGKGKSPVTVNKSLEKISEAVLSICKIDKAHGKCNIHSIVSTGTNIEKYDINKGAVQTDGCDRNNDETSCESEVRIRKIEEEPEGSVSSCVSSSVSSVLSMDKDKCSQNDKTKRVSFVLPKDKEENLDTSTDTTGDLVIDMDKCGTTQDTIDTESTVSTVQSKETDDTEKTVELKEDSSDTVDVDDLDLPDNDYHEEPFSISIKPECASPTICKIGRK